MIKNNVGSVKVETGDSKMKKMGILLALCCFMGIGVTMINSKPVHAATQDKVSYLDFMLDGGGGGQDIEETHGDGKPYKKIEP